jgi:hypothetical protein
MEESEKGPSLTAKEIEAISERLKSGQYLPEYLRDRLFQTQQEVTILANTEVTILANIASW